jgi:hypothetical protein
MQLIINRKAKNWIACLLICLCYFNLFGQQGSNDSTEQMATGTDFPKVISNDCDSSLESCIGTIVWEDGSKYEGEFQHGRIQGQGKLSLPDGSYYEGEFADEFFNGTGTMIYEDGSKYIGDWVLGYREGEGTLIYPDGTEYLGEFESDQIHGEGSMILSSGESYSGSWEYGQTSGFGMITRLDGSVYLGMNEEGARHGSGMIVWETGDTLHGSWLDGKMIEEGTFQFEDGSTMISYWENGIMKDENIYIKADGEQFASSTKELADEVLQNSWNDMEIVERNFGLAFYAIGIEYKSIMDFDRAEEHLQYAMEFGDLIDDFSIKEMAETQMANISSEKENNGGVAKSAEEDH